jgi:hypothetical protein
MENNRSKKMGRGGMGLAAGCFFGVSKEETWHIFGNFVFAVMPFELQLWHLNCSCDIAFAVLPFVSIIPT